MTCWKYQLILSRKKLDSLPTIRYYGYACLPDDGNVQMDIFDTLFSDVITQLYILARTKE